MGRKFSKKSIGGIAAFAQSLSEASNEQTSSDLQGPETVISGKALRDISSASAHTSEIVHRNGRDEDSAEKEGERESPSPKRRKIEAVSSSSTLLDRKYEKYDASKLVDRYTVASEVPDHLQKSKDFFQRYRLFSLYDEGCLLDEEGWYSITPEHMADQIAERCRCDTVLDAFCGVGGNAIAFAKTCHRVIALDNSATRLALARHNAIIYGVADRIEFILGDFLDFAKSYTKRASRDHNRLIDVVFLSPPWGGPSYMQGSPNKKMTASKDEDNLQISQEYSLQSIMPIPGDELFNLARKITPNIAYFLPRTAKLAEISALVPSGSEVDHVTPDARQDALTERIEIEEEYMSKKLKALTCYFGGLVTGQEELFQSC